MKVQEVKIAIKVLDELNNKKQKIFAELIDEDKSGNAKFWEEWEEDAIQFNLFIQNIKEELSLLGYEE